MSDDLTKRGPQDRNRVNVHERWELNYWSKKFGVSPEELNEAVQHVGTDAVEVERYVTSRAGANKR